MANARKGDFVIVSVRSSFTGVGFSSSGSNTTWQVGVVAKTNRLREVTHVRLGISAAQEAVGTMSVGQPSVLSQDRIPGKDARGLVEAVIRRRGGDPFAYAFDSFQEAEATTREALASMAQPKRNPRRVSSSRGVKAGQKRRYPKPPFHVTVWEERDNLQIVLWDADDNEVASWTDDDARQMFEDGFFDRRRLEQSVIEYARYIGILAATMPTKNPARRVRSNPPRRGQLLGTPLVIRYRHATDGKLYEHKFGRTARVELMPDGSVRICSTKGKPMWGDF